MVCTSDMYSLIIITVSQLGRSLRREEGFPLTLKKYLKEWIPVLEIEQRRGPTCCSHPEVDLHGGQSATKAKSIGSKKFSFEYSKIFDLRSWISYSQHCIKQGTGEGMRNVQLCMVINS